MFGLQLPLIRKPWVTLFEPLQIKWEINILLKKSSCVCLFIVSLWCWRWAYNNIISLTLSVLCPKMSDYWPRSFSTDVLKKERLLYLRNTRSHVVRATIQQFVECPSYAGVRHKAFFLVLKPGAGLYLTYAYRFQKWFVLCQLSLKNGRPRRQVIKLATLEMVKAWGTVHWGSRIYDWNRDRPHQEDTAGSSSLRLSGQVVFTCFFCCLFEPGSLWKTSV